MFATSMLIFLNFRVHGLRYCDSVAKNHHSARLFALRSRFVVTRLFGLCGTHEILEGTRGRIQHPTPHSGVNGVGSPSEAASQSVRSSTRTDSPARPLSISTHSAREPHRRLTFTLMEVPHSSECCGAHRRDGNDLRHL